jgi:hypothetical protein
VDDSSTTLNLRRQTASVARAVTLDGFVEETGNIRGLYLRDVEPLTTLIVRTCNSCYRMIVSRDTSAIVQGGQFFPDATPGRIDGSGFGGSFLKVGWIGIGLRMEIFADGQRIITSPVRDISLERCASPLLH